ncbi:hypothetical protein KTD31_02810 [Burkholderia multivorans]|uniref:hypothetical protein n=1 Tax=Burkholderia multivorans TaxID=87883 RepID=UPI001C24BBCE|nr:hypothetical protein [Burkholderia multivorans]MBU9200295.1 hypothetical protein [Burkholderia multivorans]MDN8078579.1 hypothetical protein [Burkholderia multivorans]
MCQAIMAATIQWPKLEFGPVNLFSLPAAWKQGSAEFHPTPSVAGKVSVAPQVNPHIQRILAYR